MITKEKVKQIVEKYIKDKNIPHTKLLKEANEVRFKKDKEIAHGEKEGEIKDVYLYRYLAMWTQEEKGMTVYVDAHTGELLYIMTPHWYIDIEK